MEDRDNIEIRLWELIDGISNEADMEQVSVLIATDPIWKAKYEELLSFNAAIVSGLELDEPPVRFTKNVMDMVADVKMAPSINGYINPSVIKGIAAFFVISIILVVGYSLSTVSWTITASSFKMPSLKLPALDLPAHFNSTFINVAIGINVILGLLFADMMLRKRDRKKQHQ